MDTFRSSASDAACCGPLSEVRAMAARVSAVLRAGEALLVAGRPVDLRGLEAEVGRLCAASLDLPPDQGRVVRQPLADLLPRLHAIEAALRAHAR